MYKVIENFAPGVHENIVGIMSGPEFAWYYQGFIAKAHEETEDEFYFTHTFYSGDTNSITSEYFDSVILPICFLVLGTDIPMIRAKANLFTKTHTQMKHSFHTDYQFDKHTTLVYSVNTNNGYTEFQDGTIIPSIANQLLIFDGNMEHRSVSQTDIKNRMNLNINLKIDPAKLIEETK